MVYNQDIAIIALVANSNNSGVYNGIIINQEIAIIAIIAIIAMSIMVYKSRNSNNSNNSGVCNGI